MIFVKRTKKSEYPETWASNRLLIFLGVDRSVTTKELVQIYRDFEFRDLS